MIPFVRIHREFSQYILNSTLFSPLQMSVLFSIACDTRISLMYSSYCRSEVFEALVPDDILFALQFSDVEGRLANETNFLTEKLLSKYIDENWMLENIPIALPFLNDRKRILEEYWSTRNASHHPISLKDFFSDMEVPANRILWDSLMSTNVTGFAKDVDNLGHIVKYVSRMLLHLVDDTIIPISVSMFAEKPIFRFDGVWKRLDDLVSAIMGLRRIYTELYDKERVSMGKQLKRIKTLLKQSCNSPTVQQSINKNDAICHSVPHIPGYSGSLLASRRQSFSQSIPRVPTSASYSDLRHSLSGSNIGAANSLDFTCKRSNRIILNVMNSGFFSAILMDAHEEKSLDRFLNLLKVYQIKFNDYPRALYLFPSIHESIDKIGYPLYKLYLMLKKLVPHSSKNVVCKRGSFTSSDGFLAHLPHTIHRNLVMLLPRLEEMISKILSSGHHDGRQSLSHILLLKLNRIWCFALDLILSELALGFGVLYKPAFSSIDTPLIDISRSSIPSANKFEVLDFPDYSHDQGSGYRDLEDDLIFSFASSNLQGESSKGRTRLRRSPSLSLFDFTSNGNTQSNFEHFLETLQILCLDILQSAKCHDLHHLKQIDFTDIIERTSYVNLIDEVLLKLLSASLQIKDSIINSEFLDEDGESDDAFMFDQDFVGASSKTPGSADRDRLKRIRESIRPIIG